MSIKRSVSLLIVLLATINIVAQNSDRFVIGYLYDKATGIKIDRNHYMEKMNVIVYTSTGDTVINENGWFDEEAYYFPCSEVGGAIKLEIDVEGYEPYKEDIYIKPFKKLEKTRTLHDIKLTRLSPTNKLGEVQVKASKIKFYYKGDTLIYNADAFDTPQGSMLDGLIRQLPGVELKQGGEIFANGKRIDALLLNGERIFNNKNEVLLENLPSYTIKNINIYTKESDETTFLHKKMDEGEYVMDVKLKRQYCKGLIGNIEAGYGTSERYLMRLFGLRFTDFSRLSFYTNINNLNDNRNPGENTQWTPDNMPRGLVARKKAGLNYLINSRTRRWKIEGGLDAVTSSSDNYQQSTQERLLPSVSLYTKYMAQDKGKYNALSSYNTLTLTRKTYFVTLRPTLSYNNTIGNGDAVSAMFNIDPLSFCKSGLYDSIRNINNGGELKAHALNRVLSEHKYRQHNYDLGLNGMSTIKLGANSLYITSSISYSSTHRKYFAQRLYDYPSGTTSPDYQNIYDKTKPNYNFNLSGSARYNLPITLESTLSIIYDYSYKESKQDYVHNLLNRLTDWSSMGDHSLGMLPSESDYMHTTADANNSYQRHEIKNQHGVTFLFNKWTSKPDKNINIEASASLRALHGHLDYYRGNGFDEIVYSGITRKNFILQSYYLRIDLPKGKKKTSHPILYYTVNQTAPDMLSLLDEFSNTSDPLNISTGNRKLKVTTEHKINFEWRKLFRDKHQTSLFFMPQWIYTSNALAYASTYDTNTGIRHFKPENVTGNYRLSYNAGINTQLGKSNKWALNFSSTTSYLHGVDLVSSSTVPLRSIVNTTWNKETLTLTRSLGKHRIGAKGTFGSSHSSSDREGFSSFTLYDYNYGLTASIYLPWDITLATDFTIYSRRGYADSGVNTNDIVWNARISKTIPKTSLTILVDGFDILNQLSNVTQIVNSQGRTETYYNALPRYVMAHIIYRFHKTPKKK